VVGGRQEDVSFSPKIGEQPLKQLGPTAKPLAITSPLYMRKARAKIQAKEKVSAEFMSQYPSFKSSK